MQLIYGISMDPHYTFDVKEYIALVNITTCLNADIHSSWYRHNIPHYTFDVKEYMAAH
jgi:hypothetical protein